MEMGSLASLTKHLTTTLARILFGNNPGDVTDRDDLCGGDHL
jgi:hypothetical protein